MGKKPGNSADSSSTEGNIEFFIANLDSFKCIAYIRRECVSTHKG